METTWIFRPAKLHRKEYVKPRGFFHHRNYIEESTWKPREFFDQQNDIEKSTWKPRGFFDHRNYIEKVRGNDVEIRRNLLFDVST